MRGGYRNGLGGREVRGAKGVGSQEVGGRRRKNDAGGWEKSGRGMKRGVDRGREQR